ncbi:MAG: hypothetical protein KY476_25555 [Planctomycetes bacterium]|nr:hypothetical protein [Planctomycetota bacterium]
MAQFCIIENDDGLALADCSEVSALEAASRAGGRLVDAGPYRSYDDAWDALLALQRDLDEEETEAL